MGQYISLQLSPFVSALLQGQWISVLIAGTGVFATLLSETKPSTNFPLLMNMCNYALLSIFLTRKFCKRDVNTDMEINVKKNESVNILWYVLAAILDVEANYMVLLAYNYTTITSVMLLDCFTIPCAMVLSYFFLGCRYTKKHLTGTFICLSGLTCIIINDSLNGDHKRGSDPVLGDVLCLCGAVLYASSNVLQEHLVKFHDRDEFLGRLGGFGFVLAFVQCMAIDLPGMRTANFSIQVILCIAGFVSCLFLMYVNTSSFLEQSDAILFNLSLLTSDVYAVIFTYFFEGYLVGWPYFLSFALVIVGLVVYHTEQPPSVIGLQLLQDEDDISVNGFKQATRANRLFGFVEDSEPRYNPILEEGLDNVNRR
jgi:solute carrier family 35 protein F1/2